MIVTGPLKHAKRKGYISEHPWQKDEMEYTHLFVSERTKDSSGDAVEYVESDSEAGYRDFVHQ